jgi:hypothetical protein
VTDPNRPPKPTGAQPPTQGKKSRHRSTSPTGTPRAGRRETTPLERGGEPALQRLRTPILALVVIAAIAGVSLFVLTSATAPAYACTTVDSVQPAASGQLGQVQPDMGSQHVQSGDKVTYPVCPPASGKHLNKPGFGPLKPKVYGPDDQSIPNGWIHNLEHGGLVLLYSCDRGACDDAGLTALETFDTGFPTSAICALPAGTVGPVVARFEQMPTRYAALVWNRVLYLDTLDTQQVYDFFSKYGERVSDGRFVAPPEPQCAVPSPSASAGAFAEPSSAGS